jgi:hypothetical protein
MLGGGPGPPKWGHVQIEMWRAAGSPALWARRIAAGIIAAALLLPLSAANALTVNVAGQDIVLTAPTRSCVFDRAEASDRKIIAELEQRNAGKNDVLIVFGDCRSMARARRGDGVPFVDGQILSPYDKGAPRVHDTRSRAEVVQEVAAVMPKLAWQDIARDAAENWKSRGQTMPTDGLKPLGVLDSDQDAIYFGIIMASQSPDGRITTVACVVGVTLVNKVMLSINLYRVYAGQGTIDALLKEQRQNIRALIKANEMTPHVAEPVAARGSSIDWQEIGVSSAIGSAIFVGLFGLYTLFQRLRDAIDS